MDGWMDNWMDNSEIMNKGMTKTGKSKLHFSSVGGSGTWGECRHTGPVCPEAVQPQRITAPD